MSAVPPRLLAGLGEIAETFDAAIVDLWGVLHDGLALYPGAAACLRALRERGLAVCLLSNAPRRAAAVAAKLRALGLGEDLYDDLVTSGEATWQALKHREDATHRNLGTRCFAIGGAADWAFFEGLDLTRVDQPEAADFVLAIGVDREEARLDEYAPVLARAAAAGLPLICANPDLVVTVGEKLCLCAGTLAAHYETLGGTVVYHGKPHAPVYRECLRRLGGPPSSRVLGIGDSLHTDIAGAHGIGARALFIAGGIHREELGAARGAPPDARALAALFAANGRRPDWVLPRLVW
jgi:HAD superfamily hydrolase (TIGR01459 family)